MVRKVLSIFTGVVFFILICSVGGMDQVDAGPKATKDNTKPDPYVCCPPMDPIFNLMGPDEFICVDILYTGDFESTCDTEMDFSVASD